MTVTCHNPDCSENGVEKSGIPGTPPPPADVEFTCGVCGDTCERSDQADGGDELELLPA